jgi:hypothetical protein
MTSNTAPARVAAPDESAAMTQHLSLMGDFLRGQERVAQEALGTTTRRTRIEVVDLTDQFSLPMEFRAILMQGAPTPRAMARHLAEAERATAADIASRGPEGDRWMHWSLGRLAVKRAARDYLAGLSLSVNDADLCVANTDEGAPRITLPSHNWHLDGTTIAHAGGLAIGAVAAAPWRIGVDYDLPERIRDSQNFIDTILSEREAANMPLPPDARTAVLLWSIKEAAAKALGVGLQGRPKEFEIVEFDPDRFVARVANGGLKVDTCSRSLGVGICSFGYLLPA